MMLIEHTGTMKVNKHFFSTLVFICSFFLGHGQKTKDFDSDTDVWVFQRVLPAPESVLKKFREAGMGPVNHELTTDEREIFKKSFSLLPLSYQKVLEQHLHSFSFMDQMPNTALTSTLDSTLYEKKFNITFRAGIFNETVSEWATWKENLCYQSTETNDYQVHVEAGDMNAMVYILLHEATHIMDQVMEISPLAQGVWQNRSAPAHGYTDPILETTRFRGGKPIPIIRAPEVYRKLENTPFVSLYSMASWHEDVAELASIYHMNIILNQPYRVLVTKNGQELIRFEPMKNELVKNRLEQLGRFYFN